MIAVLFLSAAAGWVEGQWGFEALRRTTFFVIGLAPLALLAGLLQARLARSSVGDLLVELRSNPPPAALRGALARALRDPSLILVYWVPEFESWADLDGQPVALADLAGGRATTLIDSEAGHVAALLHDPSLEDEPELLEAVAAAAAIALENARLQVELRVRLEELRGSRTRLVDAADAERRRIERDLHDGAQQRMLAVALQLRLVRAASATTPPSPRARDDGERRARGSMRELRELARGIHPAVLEHGLAAALNALASRSAVPATVSYEVDGRLPERVEFAAYFVASEALANVAKYAEADDVAMRVGAHRWPGDDRDRRRRRRRCRRDRRLGPARPGRSRRGARRPPAHLEPAGRRHRGHRGAAVRVVIADDNLLIREGIASLLRRAGIEIAAEASTADELFDAVDAHEPDVGDHRHPDAADADRRGHPRGARDPRTPPADRPRDPLPARRSRHRYTRARGEPGAARLPAQGPRQRRRRVRRHAAPRRRGRRGARPRGRVAAAREHATPDR